MTQPDGIDLGRSGWENPEGFKPRPPRHTPAPKVLEVCGERSPEGWECEKRPGHPEREGHWADNGESGGVRWVSRRKVDVTRLDEKGPVYIDGGPIGPIGWPAIVSDGPTITEFKIPQVITIAKQALESQTPASWAIALGKILELCRD